MIVRLRGVLVGATDGAALLEAGGVTREVLVPPAAASALATQLGRETTLHTYEYLEGNPAQSHLVPRLLGFLEEPDRAFFLEFVKVRGVGMRKALRAMAAPTADIAAAIERGDEKWLTELPEVGKKLAATIVAELRGKLAHLSVAAGSTPVVARSLSQAQLLAIDVLVGWGDRRFDAERLVSAAIDADASLSEPDAIVRAVYRLKQTGALR